MIKLSKQKINEHNLEASKLFRDINEHVYMLERACIDAQAGTELGEANKIQYFEDYINANLPKLKKVHEVYFNKAVINL